MENLVEVRVEVRLTYTTTLGKEVFERAYNINKEISFDRDNLAELMCDDVLQDVLFEIDGQVDDVDNEEDILEKCYEYIDERESGAEPDYVDAPGQTHLDI